MNGNTFTHLLQYYIKYKYMYKLLSFNVEKTVFKTKVGLQKCLVGEGSFSA